MSYGVKRKAMVLFSTIIMVFVTFTILGYGCSQEGDKTATGVESADWALVNGGTFEMGDYIGDGYSDQRPVHNVKLDSYYIMKKEVTVAQFEKFINETGYKTLADRTGSSEVWLENSRKSKENTNWRCNEIGEQRKQEEYNHPVVHVTWDDANEYCKWLSKKEGKTVRLPTEAEWEYAAREEGKRVKFAGTDEEAAFLDYSWISTNSKDKSQPVATKKPNSLGIYDMNGNVAEWCGDYYSDYTSENKANPKGPATGDYRVIRGSSWMHLVAIRNTERHSDVQVGKGPDVGFRCVKEK